MKLVVSVQGGGGVTESVIAAVTRFERMRVFGALVIIGVVGVAGLSFDSKIPSVVAGVAFLVIAGLGVGWLRAVRRAGVSARAVGAPATVTLTDEAIEIVSPGRSETLAWGQIMHGSATDAGWLFVAKRSNSAFLIPRAALSGQEANELGSFLSTWPKRRMRRVPASRR